MKVIRVELDSIEQLPEPLRSAVKKQVNEAGGERAAVSMAEAERENKLIAAGYDKEARCTIYNSLSLLTEGNDSTEDTLTHLAVQHEILPAAVAVVALYDCFVRAYGYLVQVDEKAGTSMVTDCDIDALHERHNELRELQASLQAKRGLVTATHEDAGHA